MSGNEDYFEIIMEKLSKVRDELVSINEKTGALKKVVAIREEILKIGWNGIVNRYHPDVNTEDPAANELFNMYKFIYEDMKNRLLAV